MLWSLDQVRDHFEHNGVREALGLEVRNIFEDVWEKYVEVTCAFAAKATPKAIRDVDWKSLSYPLLETGRVPADIRWMPPGTKKTASLINGRYVLPRNCGDDLRVCPSVTFDSVELEPGMPRLVAWLRTGSRAAQGLREVSITGGDLVLVVNDPEKQQGDCCSAGTINHPISMDGKLLFSHWTTGA